MIRKMLETKEVRKRCKLIAEYLSEDHHIAEDIMQTSFLEMIENSENSNQIKSSKDFYRVFRKHAYNALRRVKTELARYEVITDDMSTDDTELDISSYISRLPEKLRSILDMIAQGYTQTETARYYGITQGYVSRIRKRGINAIKAMVESEGL